MLISWKLFGGMAPRISPRLLKSHQAQQATNTRLTNGKLVPLRALAAAAVAGRGQPIKTIYRYGPETWFAFPGDVDVVRGSFPDEAEKRTYWTGEGGLRMTDSVRAISGGGNFPGAWISPGLPRPETPSAVAVGGEGVAASRAYVVTLLSADQTRESEPSDPFLIEYLLPGAAVTVTTQTSVTGAFDVGYKRIYRTDALGVYRFVATVPLATGTYVDDLADVALGETLPSGGGRPRWTAPRDNLNGLFSMPNGFMVAGAGNRLCFSEPYQEHAWPREYEKGLDADFVAGAAFGQMAVIGTTGSPYMLSATDPASVTLEKIESGEACLSARSMVDAGTGAVYAGPSGLVGVSGAGAQIVTQLILSPEEWRARYFPATIRAYLWQGCYVGFYTRTNGTKGGFVFNLVSADLYDLDFYAAAGYRDPITGELFLVKEDSSTIWRFDGGANLTQTWKSPITEAAQPWNPGCAQVLADAYPVTFKLWADGALKITKTVQGAAGFWLPAGYKARDIEMEVSSATTIHAVNVASTKAELAGA